MTITFVPKPNYKEVEVEGYGKVRIRPYGAGEELQITKNIRELEGLQKQAEDLLAKTKSEYKDDDKLPDDVDKDFKKIQAKVQELTDELNDLIRGTITSENPKVATRLFNELPMSEIRRLITVSNKDNNAKTN